MESMEIIIGGRQIPLYLSSWEMVAIQGEIGCTIAQLQDEVFGAYRDEENGTDGKPRWHFSVTTDAEKMRKLGTLIRIAGNAGLEEAGQEPDLTDKWILRNIKPGMILPVALAMMAVVNNSLMMETARKKDGESSGPVDVTIEEENRKKEPRK